MLISTLNEDCLQTLKVFNVTNEFTSYLVSLKQVELMAILFTGHSDRGFTGGSDGKNLPEMQTLDLRPQIYPWVENIP